MTIDEIVELADAVASSNGIASGIGTTSYGAQLVVDAASSDEAAELAIVEFTQAAARAGLPAVAGLARRDDRRGRRVIRLGSLAGYPFEGPRVLAGWTPPAAAAVYAILVTSRARYEGRAVRGHLRRSLRRSVDRTLPVQPSPGRLLAATSGRSVQARDLHLRGAGRTALTSRADRTRADRDLPAELQHRAVRRRVEGPVDRRLPRAHRRPPQHSPRPPRLNLLARAGALAPAGAKKTS